MKFVHRYLSIYILPFLFLGFFILVPTPNWPTGPASGPLAQTPCLSCVTDGEWSDLDTTWPIAPIHMHVLPNGKVLAWSRDKDDSNPCPADKTDKQCIEMGCVDRLCKTCPSPMYSDLECQNMGCTNRICDKHGYTKTYIWQPGSSGFFRVDNTQTNLFCSGHSFLSDGQLLVTGGHKSKDADGENHTNVFDFSTNSWFRPENSDMNLDRWYPTNTALGDGNALVIAGDYNTNPVPTQPATPERNPLPQIWQTSLPQPPSAFYRDLTTAQLALPFYPFVPLMPDGRIFLAGPDPATRILNTSGTGNWVSWGNTATNLIRSYGSPVVYNDGSTGGTNDGKVLILGGAHPYTVSTTPILDKISAPTNSAEIFDMRSGAPTWTHLTPPVGGPMTYARWFQNATLLPDEKVLVTGGSQGNRQDAPIPTLPTPDTRTPDTQHLGVYHAEMFNPGSRTFSVKAATKNHPTTGAQVRRLYHSVAVLLPDGKVLSGGGGLPAPDGDDNCGTESNPTPCALYGHKNVEIYSPPYLFNASGFRATRPVITDAPISAAHGDTFFVKTPDGPSISKVTLIKLSSTTHAYNMDQRINRLAFAQVSGGLNVTAPASVNDCPPGYYMLFILNSAGVPSVSKIIRIAGWEPLQGGTPDAPAASAWAPLHNVNNNTLYEGKPGRMDVFIQGLDNALWHRGTNNSMRWNNWESLGESLSARPAAVSWGRDRIDVIFKGTGSNQYSYYHKYSDGLSWSGSTLIGCCGLSAPAVSSWGPGRLDVFMQGGDLALYHMAYNGGAWSGWNLLGGILSAAPAAVSRKPNSIDVVVRGNDNQSLYHTQYNGSSWSPYVLVGCCSSDAPTLSIAPKPSPQLTPTDENGLDLFIRGLDGALWHKRWNSATGWSPDWFRMGGTLTSAPSAVSWGEGRVDIFARDSGNGIMHK